MSVGDDCNFLKAVLSWVSWDKAFFFFLNRVTEIRVSFQMSKESLCSSTDVRSTESLARTLDESCALLTRN